MKIRVGISGALGKMGQTTARLCIEDQDLIISGAFERKEHKDLNQNYGTILGSRELQVNLTTISFESLKNSDVIIDFSSPENSVELVKLCSQIQKPIVIGTTGFDENQIQQIREYSSQIPIILSPNMSMGVNILFYLVEEAALLLKDDFEVEITEIHHSKKKDSPSGTAEKLKSIIFNKFQLGEENAIYGRKGIIGERKKGEIGIHAIRGGDVVGEHTVYFFAEGERIEISHRATSRLIFARGAIKAAKWILKQSPGFYSMNDVLGIRK